MTLQMEYYLKELDKKAIDECNGLNYYQRELYKLILDMYYEDRKNTITKYYTQEKVIQSIVNRNNNSVYNG